MVGEVCVDPTGQARPLGIAVTLLGVICIALAILPLVAASQSTTFPDAALGYTFGASGESACVAAGGRWSTTSPRGGRGGLIGRCSVMPSAIGHAGVHHVGLCADGLSVCSVAFGMRGAAVPAAWADLRGALTRRYGEATMEQIGPDSCTDGFLAAPVVASLACGLAAEVAASWDVGGGGIALRVTWRMADDASLYLSYASPASLAEPIPDGRSL